MTEIPIANSDKTTCLDVCTTCHLVWFDTNEYQEMPKKTFEQKKENLSPKAREAIALSNLELYKIKKDAEDMQISEEGPDNIWELLLAYFGFPVEYDEVGLSQKPIVTWILSALIALISVAAFFDLEKIVNNWGMIPEQFGRHFGLTFISSFFLHGGLLHLVGNLYFLLIFGDNVEDFLGKYKYLLLIFLAAIIGAALHIISDVHSTIPCIGASGGISGVLAYYALRFPQNRIGLLIGFGWYKFGWLRLPVIIMFLFWMMIQILGSYVQMSGFGSVSALAHLGGVAVGFVFWLVTRPRVSGN
jgi:membrane associated rhomboid family serine protease